MLVGIKPDDYHNRPQLVAKLHHLNGQAPPEVIAIYIKLLAGLLEFSDRRVHALAVLETYTGINADDYTDHTLLIAKLRKRFRNLASESATTYMRTLASVLDSLGRSADAVMLMELDAGLQGVDYSNFEMLRTKLRRRLQTITDGTGSAYIYEMSCVLRSAGQVEKETYLINCYVMAFAQLESRPINNYSVVRHVCPLYDSWLQHFTAADRDITLSVCQQLVSYLRNSFAHQGVRLKDRREFINYVTDLRQRLLAAGHYWASHDSDSDQAKQLWLAVQLWDAELTQRLLLERFLLDRLDAPVPPTTQALKAREWPCREQRPTSSGYLPPRELFQGLGSLTEQGSIGFLEALSNCTHLDGKIASSAATPETSLERAYPKLFGRAQTIVQQGLDETRLAQLLGRNTLLLRVTFERNGRLLWTGLISDGYKLNVAAYGRSRHEGDLALLRWAAAKHDLRLELAQLSRMFKVTQQQIRFHLGNAIGSLLEYLDQVGLQRAQSQESVPSSQRSLLDVFNEQSKKLRQQERCRVLDMLDTCYGPLKSSPLSSQTYEQWAAEAARQLRQMLSFVRAEPHRR